MFVCKYWVQLNGPNSLFHFVLPLPSSSLCTAISTKQKKTSLSSTTIGVLLLLLFHNWESAHAPCRGQHTQSIRSQPTVHRRIVGNVTQAKRFTGINCYVSNEIKFGWPYNSTPLFCFVFCHMMQKQNNDEQTLKCFGWFFSYDPRFFKNLNIPHIRIGKSVFAFQSNINYWVCLWNFRGVFPEMPAVRGANYTEMCNSKS